jgi:pyruvate,water dikinase
MIYLPDSRGKIGAKGAMLFLAAKIFERKAIYQALFRKIKFPRTWYLTTESLFGFICSNNLEDIMEQKYKPLDKVSKEYPVIVQFFKNSEFPPAMIRGISMALDDLGDVPLIVRSSSLLDDLPGVELRSQYHSRFLPNQGSKQARIDAVLGAIADLYASVFGPEPIEYRVQHGPVGQILSADILRCGVLAGSPPARIGRKVEGLDRRIRSGFGVTSGERR